MRNYPTIFQTRTLWNAATGVSILVLGLLLVGLIWLIAQIFGYLQPVLIPVIIAGIVAYLLDPVVRTLEKWGMTRLKAVLTVFLGIVISFLLLLLAILPGVNQARQMAVTALSPHAATTQQNQNQSSTTASSGSETKNLSTTFNDNTYKYFEKNRDNLVGWGLTVVSDTNEEVTLLSPKDYKFIESRIGRSIVTYKDKIIDFASSGTNIILSFLGFLIGLVMVPIYLFFFLKDSASIQQHWHEYVPLKASKFKSELVDTLQEINGYLISFFRGQVLVGFIDGILVGIALTIYDLPYGFLIGIFMAILGIIPYIGNLLCLIPACLIAWVHAKGTSPFGLEPMPYMLGVVAIFVIVQQINSLVTAPKIVGDSVGLHPMTVIFSMLFWSLLLGGFVGALLAVPLSAAVKVLFRRFIWVKKIQEESGLQDSQSHSVMPVTEATTSSF